MSWAQAYPFLAFAGGLAALSGLLWWLAGYLESGTDTDTDTDHPLAMPPDDDAPVEAEPLTPAEDARLRLSGLTTADKLAMGELLRWSPEDDDLQHWFKYRGEP